MRNPYVDQDDLPDPGPTDGTAYVEGCGMGIDATRPRGAPITMPATTVPDHPADPPESFPRPGAELPPAEPCPDWSKQVKHGPHEVREFSGGSVVHTYACPGWQPDKPPVHALHVNDETQARALDPTDTLWLTIGSDGHGATIGEWIKRAEAYDEARDALTELAAAKDRDVATRAERDPAADAWQRIELLKTCNGDLAAAKRAEEWVTGKELTSAAPLSAGGLTNGQLGQIAYEAYCRATEGRSIGSGAELPTWADQVLRIQLAWTNAALAVADACDVVVR